MGSLDTSVVLGHPVEAKERGSQSCPVNTLYFYQTYARILREIRARLLKPKPINISVVPPSGSSVNIG